MSNKNMKELKPEVKRAILDSVRFKPQEFREINNQTGEILNPYRTSLKLNFECRARNMDEAKEVILREATKYFNELLEESTP